MIRSRSSILSSARLLLIFGAVGWGAPAMAQELAEGLQAHGFISQSVVHTSDNNVGGNSSDDFAWDLREMGVNLSWRPSPDWLISGQVLSRWAGESDNGELRLDYGFIDHTLIADGDSLIGVRLGKIKNPYGFFNTTRDVAHTRPGILLPQAVYIDELRNTLLAAPGVSLNGNHYFHNSSLEWVFNLVKPEMDAPSVTRYLVANQPGHFEGDPSWLGQALWEQEGGHWRMGLTLGNVKMAYKTTPKDILGHGHIALRTGVISLEHNRETWSITSEYALTRQIRDGFLPLVSGNTLDKDSTVEAGYLQGTWRFLPSWKIYLRYEALYLDQNDKSGRKFSALTGGALPAIQRFSRDSIIGIRYDPTTSWALSAEYHLVHGAAWLPRIDNPPSEMQPRWEMLLLQAAWRF